MKNIFRLVIGCALALNLISCGGGGGSGGSTASTCSAGSSAGTGSSAVTTLGVSTTGTGTGTVAANGATVTVNYTGWLYNSSQPNNEGTEFGSSNGTAFSFVLGAGEVIAGWDQGLVGVQQGQTVTLTIPSSLGYGTCPVANSPIPPDSALVFQIQVLSVTN